ncbi:MAG TPA: helix-turn-helix transcriptional regulator [Chloroflexota bacterium]|nr:helix-turn-helix transcriptional regulator [Chloroflexota bacterium]
MIRNEKEYQEALRRLEGDEDFIAEQQVTLRGLNLTPDEVARALEPALSFHAQLMEEVAWYERVRRRDFEVIEKLTAIGRLLIAARIANGVSQRELADRLGVAEAQVSRDERNEYHGITVERAQRIFETLGETITMRIGARSLTAAS